MSDELEWIESEWECPWVLLEVLFIAQGSKESFCPLPILCYAKIGNWAIVTVPALCLPFFSILTKMPVLLSFRSFLQFSSKMTTKHQNKHKTKKIYKKTLNKHREIDTHKLTILPLSVLQTLAFLPQPITQIALKNSPISSLNFINFTGVRNIFNAKGFTLGVRNESDNAQVREGNFWDKQINKHCSNDRQINCLEFSRFLPPTNFQDFIKEK